MVVEGGRLGFDWGGYGFWLELRDRLLWCWVNRVCSDHVIVWLCFYECIIVYKRLCTVSFSIHSVEINNFDPCENPSQSSLCNWTAKQS